MSDTYSNDTDEYAKDQINTSYALSNEKSMNFWTIVPIFFPAMFTEIFGRQTNQPKLFEH